MTPRTRTRATLVALVTLALASPAFAATTPPGVNIRWDNCFDDGGLMNKTFACNTNAGQEQLVVSLVLAEPMLDVSGQEIVVDIRSASATLPAWWAFKNAGTCRTASLTMNSTISASAVNCLDWANGAAAGGIGAYNIGARGANTARLVAALAVAADAAADLVPGTEYFSFNLNINNLKTVGTGSCAGCQNPVCIVFNSIAVVQPVPLVGVKLTGPSNGTDSNFATWQGGAGVTVPPGPWTGGGIGCPAATPTTNKTWGQVKTLYR